VQAAPFDGALGIVAWIQTAISFDNEACALMAARSRLGTV
jgi:hypothetical protein